MSIRKLQMERQGGGWRLIKEHKEATDGETRRRVETDQGEQGSYRKREHVKVYPSQSMRGTTTTQSCGKKP